MGSGGNGYGSGSAAAAAERRAAQGAGKGISSEKAASIAERRQKDDLIGKICHYYSQAGEKEPFGLSAASVDALKKHLAHAKALKTRK